MKGIILIAIAIIIIGAAINWGIAYLLIWLASLCFGFTMKIAYVWFLWLIISVLSGICTTTVTVNK